MLMSSAVKKYPKYYYKHPLSRPQGRQAPVETQRVYPVLTADQLLKQRERRKVVDQIRLSCGASVEYYNALYQQLIDNYAEFVQSLPLTHNHRISRLDKQLHLASIAISLREPYILAGEVLNRTTDHEKALWNYVIFSALLLSRLGQIVTQYSVSICDEKGVFVKPWEPFVGKMADQGSYYKIRNMETKLTAVDSQLNFAIARQLMPEDGYNWIASVPEALEQWIQALDSTGEQGAGTLTPRIFVLLKSWLAEQNELLEGEAEALFEKYLEEKLDEYVYDEDLSAEFHALLSNEPVETLTGERFYQWMRKGIQDKRLTVNEKDSAIFMTQQGALLLHPEIFEKFIQEHPAAGNPQHVFEQFSKLGLVANSNLEKYVSKFPGLREHNVQGVLLKDPKTLFGDNPMPMLTPYLLRANVLKRDYDKRSTEKYLVEGSAAEAKHKAHEADLDAKDAQKENLPKLQQNNTAYKEMKITNKPPMRTK